jgi:ubiquinone/menaquinone biosynthesis C-methylase UbiE
MSALDPFGRTDQLDETTLNALVARFEARGASPLFSRMLHEYLDAMDIDGAASVLDMGCGTGLAARAIARRADFSGTVLGIDLSPYLVAAAQRLAAEEGIDESVAFRAADAGSVEADDATFDAVITHTLLSHVEHPEVVLREAARVLRPGGMLGIFDGDYASLTFGNADPTRGQAYDEALISAVVTNPRVMRQLPRLLPAAGLELVDSFSHVLSEIGRADFWSSAIEAYRRLIPKAGVMSENDADAWAAELRRDSEAGVFFGSSVYYAYVARRR